MPRRPPPSATLSAPPAHLQPHIVALQEQRSLRSVCQHATPGFGGLCPDEPSGQGKHCHLRAAPCFKLRSHVLGLQRVRRRWPAACRRRRVPARRWRLARRRRPPHAAPPPRPPPPPPRAPSAMRPACRCRYRLGDAIPTVDRGPGFPCFGTTSRSPVSQA